MANTFQLLSYANTFDNWVVLTNQQAIELNALGKNDWTKDSGILILNGTPTSLQANNQAIFSGSVQVTGIGSSLYVQNRLNVDSQVYFTNTTLGLTNNGRANIGGQLSALGTNTGLFVANTANIGGALNVNGISTFNNNITLSSSANLIFNDSSIQTTAAAPYFHTNAAFNQANVSIGIDNTQNNQIQAVYNQANNSTANITIIQGIDATQNLNISIIQGVDATQNIRIQSAFNLANLAVLPNSANLTGTINLFGTCVVTGPYQSNIVSPPALDIDCSNGNYFTKTISGTSTFTFSNAPVGRAFSFTLELNITSGSVTWPASVVWPNSTAPSLSAGLTSLLMFVTDNGGTTWRGSALPNYTT